MSARADQTEKKSPLIVIVGPTAVGKTEISLQLAERLNGEIISIDSRLFYRGMDIGTAKPSTEEQARVPHHLIDVANPDETWSLAVFQKAVREIVTGVRARRRLPFLVGGTGQYVRAVVEAWEAPRVKPDPRLRTVLENWAAVIGKAGLHQRLAALDPEAAEKIDYRNLRRTVRALEVILTTGRQFSKQRRRAESPYDVLMIGLIRPRSELYARIDIRIEEMLSAGLVEEVQRLLDQGYGRELPSMSAIGYREIAAYLEGEISLEEAVVQIRKTTRVYVRRQTNWFKPTDERIHWFQVGEKGVVKAIENEIRNWLNFLKGKM